MSKIGTGLSIFFMLDIVWLHSACYGVAIEDFPVWMRVVWGMAVPWFFVNSMIWMVVKWRGLGFELERRVRSLLLPYFCWCLLGAGWSVALHGVQFEGFDLLRYVG